VGKRFSCAKTLPRSTSSELEQSRTQIMSSDRNSGAGEDEELMRGDAPCSIWVFARNVCSLHDSKFHDFDDGNTMTLEDAGSARISQSGNTITSKPPPPAFVGTAVPALECSASIHVPNLMLLPLRQIHALMLVLEGQTVATGHLRDSAAVRWMEEAMRLYNIYIAKH